MIVRKSGEWEDVGVAEFVVGRELGSSAGTDNMAAVELGGAVGSNGGTERSHLTRKSTKVSMLWKQIWKTITREKIKEKKLAEMVKRNVAVVGRCGEN